LISEKHIDKLYKEICIIDKNNLKKLEQISLEDNSGGKQRGFHGSANEELLNLIIAQIAKNNNIKIEILKGEKKDKKYITNAGGKLCTALDSHIYVDNKLKCVLESKYYMDASMFKRCLFEIQNLKFLYPDIKALIVQFENGLGKEVLAYAQNNLLIDKIINLSSRNRQSSKTRFLNNHSINFLSFKELYECLQQYLLFKK